METIMPGGLLERIGNRTVLIDANLPIQLATALRRKGLVVRHVHEIDPNMSDTYIQIIMLDTDVLLTRDRNLRFKVSKTRSILLPAWMNKRMLLATVEDEEGSDTRPQEEPVIQKWRR